MSLPWDDNFGVVRLDHDFGSKWHFYSTYRYYQPATRHHQPGGHRRLFPWRQVGRARIARQSSIGALVPDSRANNEHHEQPHQRLPLQLPAQLLGTASNAQPPQVAGLGGALEPNGESATNVLAPFNLDTQDVRTRFWDGQDNMIRDDLSWSKGTHFFQFGGIYQHNWDYHQRTDNGGGINYQTVYWFGASVGTTNGMDMSGFVPAAVSAAELSSTGRATTRSRWAFPVSRRLPTLGRAQNLTLNPPNTPAFDQSTIPFYNLYFSDSWRMKPTFTLSYGLGWTLEMPPVEAKGSRLLWWTQNAKLIDTQTLLECARTGCTGRPSLQSRGWLCFGRQCGGPPEISLQSLLQILQPSGRCGLESKLR